MPAITSANAFETSTPMQDHLIHVRHLLSGRERAMVAGRARRGELVAVARGVYLDSEEWARMDRHARYRTQVIAVARTIADVARTSRFGAAVTVADLPPRWVRDLVRPGRDSDTLRDAAFCLRCGNSNIRIAGGTPHHR